ncbi:MAG: glycerol-3-phosphate 1-O-acyltransferase PlsY [Betaproteobacteria bacterium]|nr:glycerol-3-phosphate 1-O-acyltransferase PlsY [Betaproteobacteria bacterium]
MQMLDILISLFAAALAYVLGSIPFAVVVSRVMGLSDPRSYGSGNPGATNVLRSGNKKAAAATLVLDAFKGGLAVWLGARAAQAGWLDAAAVPLLALAVLAGHLWPMFLRFRGGKGVATAAGVLLAVNPWLGLATIATWLIVAVFFRYSSLAALAAAVFAPFYAVIGQDLAWRLQPAMLLALGAISLLVIWRHQGNIRKLLRGEESRIGAKAGGAPRKKPRR